MSVAREPTGFLGRKIIKANFNDPTEDNLNPDQYDRLVRFLRFHNPPAKNDSIDVILIPGTSPYFDLESFDMRVEAALRYSKIYPHATVIFSGKRPDLSRATVQETNADYSEARVMAQAAIENGLDKNRVVLEEEALHTGQNIKNTLEMLIDNYPTSLLVISSGYLSRRLDLYLKRELRERSLLGRLQTFTFDADVAEDLNGEAISAQAAKRKRKRILTEGKRLSQYRKTGDL